MRDLLKSIAIILVTIPSAVIIADESSSKHFTESGYTSLFNGKDMTGWKNPYNFGEVKIVDEEIHLKADKKFFLVTEKSYRNFRVSVDILLPEGKANSGVMFRCHVKPGKVFGYQAECDGSDRCWSGGLYDEGRRQWVWPSIKGRSEEEFLKHEEESQIFFKEENVKNALKRNDWNRFEVECRGPHIVIYVNGVKTTDLIDHTDAEGPIGIQHHGEKGQTYKFRNLFIKEFPDEGTDKPQRTETDKVVTPSTVIPQKDKP